MTGKVKDVENSNPRVTCLGDDMLSVGVDNPVQAKFVTERITNIPGLEDIVAGMDSVAIRFDPLVANKSVIEATLSRAANSVATMSEWGVGKIIEIPVTYGGDEGPDLATLSTALKLSVDEIIARHTATLHSVELIGFLPGFAYLSGLEPSLTTPRLKSPRTRVPAGSIAISGAQTGIYALPSPGGWSIIGRTNKVLFDPERPTPTTLEAGDRVRFVAQSK
ncbi:MAG: 5-oxoprolinase subunit PxpB [Pseudomonadota bacterium]